MGDCKNCDNTECCDNCGDVPKPEMSGKDKEKALFLSALGVVLEKHLMSWRDVDVDWEAGKIDIEVDTTNFETMSFLTDLHKITGGHN